MQNKKEDVKNIIMNSARQDFLEFGFEKASLRQIAAKAGVTKGNIYTYFTSKDELFCHLVEPALKFIKESMIQGSADPEYFQNYGKTPEESFEFSRKNFVTYADCLFLYTDELKLLFFASPGSSLENFREKIFELYSQSSQSFFENIAKVNPSVNKNISIMLIHSLASMYLSFIEEVIVHKPQKKELDLYLEQIATFYHFGMMEVMYS
ncbi:MAG: TetR/AcrR family transcriptional regulator [Spirochaetes bacterium]|nr:TetR/AcrR family transcriptional regulator [Spirochaetota bacterium]